MCVTPTRIHVAAEVYDSSLGSAQWRAVLYTFDIATGALVQNLGYLANTDALGKPNRWGVAYDWTRGKTWLYNFRFGEPSVSAVYPVAEDGTILTGINITGWAHAASRDMRDSSFVVADGRFYLNVNDADGNQLAVWRAEDTGTFDAPAVQWFDPSGKATMDAFAVNRGHTRAWYTVPFSNTVRVVDLTPGTSPATWVTLPYSFDVAMDCGPRR
jgi:hypothetical protein